VESERTDPRITRTTQAVERAIVELAAQRPVSRITVADLAERAGVTRATIYNRYRSPLEPLRLATAEVADHVERFEAVYRHALNDPADRGVYDALVRHFSEYALAFIDRRDSSNLPDADHQVMAQFVAHGFAGAIKAWLGEDSVTKADLIDAAVACAPSWWR
jgi:AcrR family transcriptional regulator